MNNLSNKLVSIFIKNNIIDEKDKEIYIYGLNQGIIMIFNIITVIIIGIILNMLFLSLLFIITYIPIRVYAGGFHCRTQTKCYIFSVIMQICVLLLCKVHFLNETISILTISITGSIIGFLLSPVEDINKRLDDLEVKVYKKKARTNIIIIQFLTLLTLKYSEYSLIMALAICCSGLMLILGKIYNIIYTKKLIESKQ